MRKMSARGRYCLGGERVSKMRVRKIKRDEGERPGCLATGGRGFDPLFLLAKVGSTKQWRCLNRHHWTGGERRSVFKKHENKEEEGGGTTQQWREIYSPSSDFFATGATARIIYLEYTEDSPSVVFKCLGNI